MHYLHRVVLKTINLLVDVLIQFYSMEDQIRGERDLRRELLFNLMVNNVLEDELYFVIFNITASFLEPQIQQLKKVMNDKALLENRLPMSRLSIAPQF